VVPEEDIIVSMDSDVATARRKKSLLSVSVSVGSLGGQQRDRNFCGLDGELPECG
jgi:hypothetical protein